jgi:hypothetical protein
MREPRLPKGRKWFKYSGYRSSDLFKLRGGSPRIHAGELGFQAERLA